MITLASIAKARHVYASVATEAKMEIQRDAVYWLLTHTDVASATLLRGISGAFTEGMQYPYMLDTWESLKKGEVVFCLLQTLDDKEELYLELEPNPMDDSQAPWPNKVA